LHVELDHHSLVLDGARRIVRAGSLHYFRLPGQGLWEDRIEKMKAAGLNAVDIYYPWNYHCEFQDEYDFTGIRDLDKLHDLIEQAGMWLIARPGPYICAEIDAGGLPAWLLQRPGVLPRCRSDLGFSYSRDFMQATREWFSRVVPTFAERSNLILVQVENEYTLPAPLSDVPRDLLDLAISWFGARGMRALTRTRWARRLLRTAEVPTPDDRQRGQANPYMRELYEMVRELGVKVPVFHNDLSSTRGRQTDVDMLAVDRYPITDFTRDWRDEPGTFDVFGRDEAGLDAHRDDNPLFYPELQGGWYDAWGGPGYDRVRELLGSSGIDNATKAALAARATLWNYYVFCGGVTWGYLSSPDVYSSYDYGAPITESGRPGARCEAVRELNRFIEAHEEDLASTDVEETEPWCPQHLVTRRGEKRRYVFLRNPTRGTVEVPTPETERSELEPWETQIRVYGPDGSLEDVSPVPVEWAPPAVPEIGTLPELEDWAFSGTSPQLDPSYDDAAWSEIPGENLSRGAIDIDSLGVHYGFIWYRGTFQGPLDRLFLDARHCWAVWINRQLVASGDQFRNTLGVGPDGARLEQIELRGVPMNEGRNVIVVLVESMGHNKGFADDFRNPRGIVRLETGSSTIRWRYRGGLLRGERGLAPVVAVEGVERSQSHEVVLPHAWEDGSEGVGLYETRFRLEGVDPARHAVAALFDPGRGKANLYLNGYLLGRYWPERGPQQRFVLPWGVLEPEQENHLAVALWKRSPSAALGRVRLVSV
jgi:hypothetical protein